MSYILDALKRSDRSRQLNTTHEMGYSPDYAEPKEQTFWLKLAVILLSLVTLIALLYAFWPESEDVQPNISIDTSVSSTGANSNNSQPRQVDSMSTTLVVSESLVVPVLKTETTLERPPPPISQVSAQSSTGATNTTISPASQPRRSLSDLSSALKPATQAQVSTPTPVTRNVTTSAPPQQSPANEPRTDFTGYANYRTVKNQYELPDLHLDILMYHPEIEKRKAYINMAKYYQGDKTQDGVELMKIGEEGVLMSYQGKDFVLTAK